MYVKLFDKLLRSSVWAEDAETRIVWLTLLLLADRDGVVIAAPSGVARAANVDPAACRKALDTLSKPDLESGTQEYGGRRIDPIEGGWLVLNYAKYRDIRDIQQHRAMNRERVRRHRASKLPGAGKTVTPGNAECNALSPHTDTDTDTDTTTVSKETGAGAGAKPTEAQNLSTAMGLIRASWSVPEQLMTKQGSQLKALRAHGHDWADITRAIVGLALLHGDGSVKVAPHMGLLYNKDTTHVPLYQRAIARCDKEDERNPKRRREGQPVAIGELLQRHTEAATATWKETNG